LVPCIDFSPLLSALHRDRRARAVAGQAAWITARCERVLGAMRRNVPEIPCSGLPVLHFGALILQIGAPVSGATILAERQK
jgi:hypothetical protein